MIKDLWITEIDNEIKLRKVLKILGDDTWEEWDIEDFLITEITSIAYSQFFEEYLTVRYLSDVNGHRGLKRLTYQEFINKYSKEIK